MADVRKDSPSEQGNGSSNIGNDNKLEQDSNKGNEQQQQQTDSSSRPSPVVRFLSEADEIPVQSPDDVPETPGAFSNNSLSPDSYSFNFHQASAATQQRRLSHFDYQPLSLPPSRVPSITASTHGSDSQSLAPPSGHDSPRHRSPMHSPPLTPAHTHDPQLHHGGEGSSKRPKDVIVPSISQSRLHPSDPATMTPQISPPRSAGISRHASGSEASQGGRLEARRSSPVDTNHLREPKRTFSIGPESESAEASPTQSTTPIEPSGLITPTYGRSPTIPTTPAGEHDDPYARSRRPPPSKNLQDIEPRFIFARGSKDNLTSDSASSASSIKEKRSHSHFSLASLAGRHGGSSTSLSSTKNGSMTELKRFFKGGQKVGEKKARTPSGLSAGATNMRTFTPSPTTVPFSEDHGLQKKYGKFGKVLGSGAGGSVRLMKRASDGVTFAVKEFRPKHSYETEREYAKKVTAEFCIGSTLHHGNIIETLDIVHERGRWYEVMQYCPYDLFATVMTGKMSKEEITCAFLQVLSGVTYLHGMGLAHRDLKLDNIVINEHGIMKIIDFGSASVFRYPFENDIVEATGIVGSDPYLAPEVCNEIRYDPQPADIWSLAIIYCCMTLRRFPWKAPRQSDHSFRLFSSAPSPGTPIHQRTPSGQHILEPAPSHPTNPTSPPSSDPAANTSSTSSSSIKGPWRLLRLLPREARGIMAGMLELDPRKRATLDEIWKDEWISQGHYCRMEDDGRVVRAEGHGHVLERQGEAQKD